MRVLVCGGRDYANKTYLWNVLDSIGPPEITEVISGMASGADSLAAQWADLFGFQLHKFPADWENLSHADAVIRTRRDGTKYDAKAGHRRNQRMLDEGKPDLVIAFPGKSGTADMISRARKAGVKVEIFE